MKVSDYVAEYLYDQGVGCVFEVIGGMITHLVDSIYKMGKIKLISTHHEQGAAFAADGYARITGVPGVAMATSGPGATNLLTGIGSCYFDSVPAVFITGQVNRNEQKGDRPIRQLGFQETDIVSIVEPITKATWKISEAEQVPDILEEAFFIALSGRPGPVLIDIPMDIQRANISAQGETRAQLSERTIGEGELEYILREMSQAKKPLILAGGGIRAAQAVDLFQTFVDFVNVPVVNSLMAVDVLPYQHPLRVGLIGSYGNRWTNLAVGLSDFLLVLGSRLDIRQTGADVEAFASGRKIFHIDIEEGEINQRVHNCYPILAHLKTFLNGMITQLEEFPQRSEWLTEIDKLRQAWPDTEEIRCLKGINPNQFMHYLSKESKASNAFVVDVGNNQMWAAQSLELDQDQKFLTSGGMGSMGYALPAAIGASFAAPKKPVVMISGDGGMQVNIQELQTVVHHNLPIKMVILNNHSLGMVRQFQQSYFDERYQSTYWGYSSPDFVQVAQAYGIEATKVVRESDFPKAFKRMWQVPQAPFLLEVVVDVNTNVYPKIAFGHPLTEMEPFAKPIDMEGT